MAFLKLLEAMRQPWLDACMLGVTFLGDETVFLALILILFWFGHEKTSLRIGLAGLAGTALNQLLKAVFIVPRPWLLDPSFTIVEAARAAAGGYSFPSGHTQSAVVLFLFLALYAKKRWQKGLCIAAAALTAFSRMYLGVHTPLDVGVSVLTGAATVWVCQRVYQRWDRGLWYVLGAALTLTGALFAVAYFVPVRAQRVAEFDMAARKNAWTLLGTLAALGLYLKTGMKQAAGACVRPIWYKTLMTAVGFCMVLSLKSLLKAPLAALTNGHEAANALRYAAAVLAGVWLTPWAFDRLEMRKGRQKMADASNRLLFILNPHAGRYKTKFELYELIEQLCRDFDPRSI